MPRFAEKLLERLGRVTIAEWIVTVVIIGILIALLLSNVYSVGTGEIDVAVRVLVFDVTTSQPIENAKVAIVWGGWPHSQGEVRELAGRFPDADFEDFPYEETQADGSASIAVTFATNSSTRNPGRADTSNYWVVISANGYGMMTTPLRYERTFTQSLLDSGNLFVTVGLYRASVPTD